MTERDVFLRKIPEEAIRKLRALAALEGRRVGEVVADAVEAYLQNLEQQGKNPFKERSEKGKES